MTNDIVLFSDESRFSLSRADGRQRVYRRRGERYVDTCLTERDRFGGGSIMYNYKTPLIVIDGNLTAVKFRNEVRLPYVAPIAAQNDMIFQQDNGRPHVVRVSRELLAANNVLDWAPYSPDFSLIEQLWDELDCRIRCRVNVPSTRQGLLNALPEE